MFNIIFRNLKTLSRDKASLFLMTLFPVILVFLLGNLLANLDHSDAAIDPMVVEYQIEATDERDVSTVKTFIKELEKNQDIDFVKSKDKARSIKKVNQGSITAFVAFTKSLDIELSEGLDDIQNRTLNIIMRGFVDQTASINTLAEENPMELSKRSELEDQKNVTEKDFGYNRTMLDYYAVAMVIMILFMGGAIGGSTEIYQGRINGTLRRMTVSPIKRSSLYIQTVLGTVPQVLLQVIVIMIPSVLIFGANYAQNAADNLVLFAMFVTLGITINAVFTIVGLLVKSDPSVILMSLLWVLMFISGTFSKEIYIEGVTECSPVWQAQNAAFQLTIFGDSAPCIMIIGVCLGILAAATAIGAFLFNRKEIIL